MMNKFRYFLIFIGICAIFLGCTGKTTLIPGEVKENIKLRVDSGINTGIVVGVVTPEVVEYYSYGYRSLDSKELIDENAVFEIASVSKVFTGIMLAEMVINDELELNDPIQNLLPSTINAPTKNQKNIQLVQLANHTSGLPRMPTNFKIRNLVNPFSDYSEELLYEFLTNYELTRDTGQEYEYSNYGFGLLGHILAAKNGSTYNELLLSQICKPLNLDNTNTVFSPNMKSNLAKGHKLGVEVPNWDYQSSFAGAAGIRSSPVDMTKFLSYNMGLLPTNLSKAMHLSHKNTRLDGEKPRIGLGWMLTKVDDTEFVWHDGETSGYRSFIGFLKNGSKGVVVLTNSNADINDIGMHILNVAHELETPKPSIGMELRRIIENEGVQDLDKSYLNLKENQLNDFEFGENELEMLGHLYVDKGKIEKAVSVFKLNSEAYPNSSDAFFNYGRALAELGLKKEAISALMTSIDLYPGNFYSVNMLKELDPENLFLEKEIVLEESVLEGYVGKYELMPTLILEVFKEGNQLKTRASGKSERLIYPKSETSFYYKTIPAQVIFETPENGKAERLTFIQEGEKIIAKRISY